MTKAGLFGIGHIAGMIEKLGRLLNSNEVKIC